MCKTVTDFCIVLVQSNTVRQRPLNILCLDLFCFLLYFCCRAQESESGSCEEWFKKNC